MGKHIVTTSFFWIRNPKVVQKKLTRGHETIVLFVLIISPRNFPHRIDLSSPCLAILLRSKKTIKVSTRILQFLLPIGFLKDFQHKLILKVLLAAGIQKRGALLVSLTKTRKSGSCFSLTTVKIQLLAIQRSEKFNYTRLLVQLISPTSFTTSTHPSTCDASSSTPPRFIPADFVLENPRFRHFRRCPKPANLKTVVLLRSCLSRAGKKTCYIPLY